MAHVTRRARVPGSAWWVALVLMPGLASAQAFGGTFPGGGGGGAAALSPSREDTAASYTATGPNGVKTAAQASPASLGTCAALAGAYASATPTGESGTRPYFCDGIAWRRVYTSADGALPNADTHVPGRTFISQAPSGLYGFVATNNSKWDLGAGPTDEIWSDGTFINGASWRLGSVNVVTLANRDTGANLSVSLARNLRLLPNADAPSAHCGTNDSGGIKVHSTDGNRLYYCDGTRHMPVARLAAASASLDLPEVAAGGRSSAQVVTGVAGAAVNERARCEAATDLGGELFVSQTWVSAANEVSFYVRNAGAVPLDPAAVSFNCWVVK